MLEINDCIFIGYSCPVDGKAGSQPLQDKEIKNILKVEPAVENWWHTGIIVLTKVRVMHLIFKYLNDEYFNLFEEQVFIKFVYLCVERIKNMLGKQ